MSAWWSKTSSSTYLPFYVMTRTRWESLEVLVDEIFARRLLWNLLSLVLILHQAGLAHNDIGPRTMLLINDSLEHLLLAGFSKWSLIYDAYAKPTITDCLQIFQAVRDCLGNRAKQLKPIWTGDTNLDMLWARLNGEKRAWSDSTQDVCDKLKISPYSRVEL